MSLIAEQPTAPAAGVQRVQAFLSDVGALGILQVLHRLPGLLLLPILSHTYGAEGFGIWSLFFVLGETLGVLCDFVLDDALVRFVSGTNAREERSEYFYSILLAVAGASIVVATVLGLAAQPFSRVVFGSQDYAPLVRLLAVYLFAEAFDGLALNMFRALLKVKAFVLLEASQIIVRTAVVVVVLWTGQGLWFAILAYMCVQAIWLVLEFSLVYMWIGIKKPTFKYLKACLTYSLPLVPTRYSNLILSYSDRLIISATLGPGAAGFYAASYDLAFLIWQLVNPIRVALFPTISRLWDQGLTGEAGQFLSRSMKLTLFLAIPSIFGLSVLAPHMLRLLATEEFARVSYVIVPLAAVAITLQGLTLLFNMLLRLHKNTRAIALCLIISASVHLLLNLLLIPSIGLVGGAIATVVGYLLDLGLMAWLAWRHSQFPLPVRPALAFLAAAVLMMPLVMWVSQGGGWTRVLSAVAAGGLVYLVIVFLLRGVTMREIRLVLRLSSTG